MPEKIKVPRKVAEAIECFLRENPDGGVDHLLNFAHGVNGWAVPEYAAMNMLTPAEMARALLLGYDVAYEVGEWIFDTVTNRAHKIIEVRIHSVITEGGSIGNSYIRSATSEEIKKESEYIAWKKAGRAVEQMEIGDAYERIDGRIYTIDKPDRIGWVLDDYKNGKLKGFYPAESFISFQDGDDQ